VKIKVVVCNCVGFYREAMSRDLNGVAAQINDDLDVAYAVEHPLLCGVGGNAFLEDTFRNATPDTYIISAGCDSGTQLELLGPVIRTTKFPLDHFVPVDVRGLDRDHVTQKILEAVSEVKLREHVYTVPGDGLDG
jgi:hypothetical protein